MVRDARCPRRPGGRRVRRCFDPATIHATCEDYRAGATIDLIHDRADASHQVDCPTVALWSKTGIGSTYDVSGIWRRRAPRFAGTALDCGHFLAEEQPEQVSQVLRSFLS